jgi:hypothetical protein
MVSTALRFLVLVAPIIATDVPIFQSGGQDGDSFQVGTRMTETSKCTGKLCSVTKFRMVSCKENEHMVGGGMYTEFKVSGWISSLSHVILPLPVADRLPERSGAFG